jgi:hypothetical protein
MIGLHRTDLTTSQKVEFSAKAIASQAVTEQSSNSVSNLMFLTLQYMVFRTVFKKYGKNIVKNQKLTTKQHALKSMKSNSIEDLLLILLHILAHHEHFCDFSRIGVHDYSESFSRIDSVVYTHKFYTLYCLNIILAITRQGLNQNG